MKATDLVRWALELSEQGTARLVNDLRDAPLTQPTPTAKGGGGNHPLWTLGHLALIEGGLPHILFGDPNPVAGWAPLFAAGTTPKNDAGAYPSFDELLGTYRALRAQNIKLLDTLDDASLDRVPWSIPPGFEDVMLTYGHTLLLMALHNMVHYGQIADARRVAGLKPML